MSERTLIYLDNAATSWPKPPEVAQAMMRFVTQQAGSPSRAGHAMADAAGKLLLDVRTKLARLIHADDPNRIILCLNATDALNMAIKGSLSEGDHVICSDLDHNSVSRPLQAMVEGGFITLTRLPLTAEVMLDPDAVRSAITPRTKLIALNHASNVIGVVQPASDIGVIAREHEVLFLMDASQSVGLLDVDVQAFGADLVAFPGHKALLGPTGTGALYVGPRTGLKPWREGGTGADSITPTQPTGYPVHLEAGTPNTAGFAGLNAALDSLAFENQLDRERRLGRRLMTTLADHPRITVVGGWTAERCVPNISLTVRDAAPEEVGAILDEAFHIAVRPGLHCAPHLHRSIGTFPQGTVRISLGWSTTEDDIDRCAAALIEVADSFK